MINRAKCKLCETVIVSNNSDYVSCKCGEIAVFDDLGCAAIDWKNFLRVDDEGNEIMVTVKEKSDNEKDKEEAKVEEPPKPTKQDLLDMLDEMIKNIERLPRYALDSPINHSDFASLLILLSSILRSD